MAASKLTAQEAYAALSANHVHWDGYDTNHIIVWTSGYITNEAHELERYLMTAGFRAVKQEFDKICGKTFTIFRRPVEAA